MLLNLKQIGGGGARREGALEFGHDLDLSAVKLWGEHPFAGPVRVGGRVDYRFGAYAIRYSAEFDLFGRCSRCLEPVVTALKREFEHTILVDSNEEDAEAAGFIPAPGAELDLDGLVTSDLLLELGGVLLCKEDCRGLCPRCGGNMNKSACGCGESEPDLRFDPIRKLLEEDLEGGAKGGSTKE